MKNISILVALLLTSSAALAQQSSVSPLTPVGTMQAGLAIASATALTVPAGATYAVVCAETGNVRYTIDGTTTPTTSVGMLLSQNSCVALGGSATLAKFQAIQVSSATLDVSYYKW